MPEVSLKSLEDRAAKGVLTNTHPRLTEDGLADVILLPEDLMEGAGNFLETDAHGNPRGFVLGQPPKITGRYPYVGTDPGRVTRQTDTPVDPAQTSFAVRILTEGAPPPELLGGSVLPRPAKPLLLTTKATVAGFPASSPQHPYWATYTDVRLGRDTPFAPAVKLPPVAQGQSLRLKLPETVPVGVTHRRIWITHPGQSSSSEPAQMRAQILVRASIFEVELNGPYVYSTLRPLGTGLPAPGKPVGQFRRERKYARAGTYRFYAVAANASGTSLPSQPFGPITVAIDPYWGPDSGAGYGTLRFSRSALPADSTGWYAYVVRDNQANLLFAPATGAGLTKPLPPEVFSIDFWGWDASDEVAKRDSYALSPSSLPVEDTTALPAPDSPLEEPEVFGASRLGPGRYFARTSDDADGEESPLSEAASRDLADDEVLHVVFANPVNKLPNATFVEQGADGLPLFYGVSGTGGAGSASLDAGELVIETDGPQTGATPEVLTEEMATDRTREWGVGARLAAQAPRRGALAGSFEAVLRETDSAGAVTDTVLATASSLGEVSYHARIKPAGQSGLSWGPGTVRHQVLYRFSGATKNMVARVSRQLVDDYAYSFRRREDVPGSPSNPNPEPEATADPAGSVALEPAPAPAQAPETGVQQVPDIPGSAGAVLQQDGFEAGIPSGFALVQENAVCAREAGAALAGSWGLASRKPAGGANAAAFIRKTFDAPALLSARSSIGVSAKRRVPTLPTNGSVTIAEVGRASDGEPFAWLDLDARNERAELAVTAPPKNSGSVVTTLDEGGTATQRSTALVATRQRSSLTLDFDPEATPLAAGAVLVTVGDETASVPVRTETPGATAQVNVEIRNGAAARGQVMVVLGAPQPNDRNVSYSYLSAVVEAGDTPDTVADKLRAYSTNPNWQHDYWAVSGAGRNVLLTAKIIGPTPYPDSFLSASLVTKGMGETHVSARITSVREGAMPVGGDTKETLARRISEADLPGHVATLSGSTVDFEALEPGAEAGASYSAGGTNATGTMTTFIVGAQDDAQAVAQKVAATYAANAYHSVSAEDNKVVFAASSSGAKLDAAFSPGPTETGATMQTTVQGSIDLVAYARDSGGGVRQKRVLENLTNATVFDHGVGVTGATQDEAVVAVWASTGGAQKTLRSLFERLDLGAHDAGHVALGVTSESSPSLTWEAYADELVITDRGETYYRYHDYLGRRLRQVHGFFRPGQPALNTLYLQGWRQAVIPGEEYTAGVFARWAGLLGGAKPFYLYGVTPMGEEKPIGCITDPATGGAGLVGTSHGWQELEYSFTVPDGCYLLRLASRGVGEGEIVCQELAVSLGPILKRTPFYATEGSYVCALDSSTPFMWEESWWGRERRLLDVDVEEAPGTSSNLAYRAADAEAGPFDAPVYDPASLAQKNVVRVDWLPSGNGLATPALRAPTPRLEYRLLVGSKPLATLLKEDRTELDGGAIFTKLDEYAEPPEVVYTRRPGARFRRTPVFGPTPNNPPFELEVFTPEARRFIEDRAGMVPLVVEAWDRAITIEVSGDVRFERQQPDAHKNGRRYGRYVAKVPEAWITDVRDLA